MHLHRSKSLPTLLLMFMRLAAVSCFTTSSLPSSLHFGSISIRKAEYTIPHGRRHRQRHQVVLSVAPQSLPPISTEAASSSINSVKDYFIPTSSEAASRRALEQYAQSKENSSGEMMRSSDFIQIDSALPGAKDSKPISRSTAFLPTETYKKEISKREVLWISQQFDIYLRRLPQAVFIYALLDFFVLPTSRAVISDELEEDRMAVVKDWTGRAVVRVGVFSTIVAATILFENVFNNSI